MLFVIRFWDKPEQLSVRQHHLQAHIQWLGEHKEMIRAAGTLSDMPQGAAVGGLWIVEAADKVAVEQMLHTDPFWIHGLRQRCDIHVWSKAFPQERALI